MNYCLIGSGHESQIPPMAILPKGHALQNLWLSDGTLPAGQGLHESSNSSISLALQGVQAFPAPLGKDPSSQVIH